MPALGKTVYTRKELEWAVTKFGSGVEDVDDGGRGRVRYAHTDNSDDPDPFPGPKLVRKAGWMGRLLLLLLATAADLAMGLDAIAPSVVGVVLDAAAGAATMDAEEAVASTIAMIEVFRCGAASRMM